MTVCAYHLSADAPALDAAACTSLAMLRQPLVVEQCLHLNHQQLVDQE